MIKRKGKIVSLLFTAIAASAILIGAGSMKVQADDHVLTGTVEKSFTANVGETLVIPLKVSSADDIRGVTGKLAGQYDDTVLKFDKAVYTDGIPSGLESVAGGNFGFITSGSFKSGTVNLEFEVLKCTKDPVTVTIKDLYASVQVPGDDGKTTTVSTGKTTLTTEVTVNHPADKREETILKEATCTEAGEKSVKCTLCGTDLGNEEIPALGHKDGVWKEVKKATCTAKGSKELHCSVCDAVIKTEEIPALGHQYGAWTTTKAATALAAGTKTRTCTRCGNKENQAVAKLAAAGTLSITNFPLKVKQKFTVTVQNMAAGDRVVSWTTSNKKVATVSSTGKVTGKKKGKATITAVLASGKKLTTTVKVQKGTVKTKSIVVNGKTLTLTAKQKYQIVAVRNPLTSQQKLTYSSSSKKIAKVDKKGRITAVKKGKATITVKSGSKKVKIKVTVK